MYIPVYLAHTLCSLFFESHSLSQSSPVKQVPVTSQWPLTSILLDWQASCRQQNDVTTPVNHRKKKHLDRTVLDFSFADFARIWAKISGFPTQNPSVNQGKWCYLMTQVRLITIQAQKLDLCSLQEQKRWEKSSCVSNQGYLFNVISPWSNWVVQIITSPQNNGRSPIISLLVKSS